MVVFTLERNGLGKWNHNKQKQVGIHPREKLRGWNPKSYGVFFVKMIFLFHWVILRSHGGFSGEYIWCLLNLSVCWFCWLWILSKYMIILCIYLTVCWSDLSVNVSTWLSVDLIYPCRSIDLPKCGPCETPLTCAMGQNSSRLYWGMGGASHL